MGWGSTSGEDCKATYLNQGLFYEFMQVCIIGAQLVGLSLNTRSPSSLLGLMGKEEEGMKRELLSGLWNQEKQCPSSALGALAMNPETSFI